MTHMYGDLTHDRIMFSTWWEEQLVKTNNSHFEYLYYIIPKNKIQIDQGPKYKK